MLNPDDRSMFFNIHGTAIILVGDDSLCGELANHLQDRDMVVVVVVVAAAAANLPAALRQKKMQNGTDPGVIRLDQLEINLDKRHVRWDGQPLSVTGQEISLLALLAGKAGRAFSFRELFTQVWGAEHSIDRSVAHSAMRRLRRKLASVGAEVAIESVRGYGFRLVRH